MLARPPNTRWQLARVLARDVGKTAQHALAARRLLAGRPVAGLLGVDHRADLDLGGLDAPLGARGAERLEHGRELGGSRAVQSLGLERGLLGVDHRADLDLGGLDAPLGARGAERLEHGRELGGSRAVQSLGLERGDGLGARHVLGVAAAQRELGQAERVGAVGARLAGGNELVGGGHLVHDLGGHA